MNAYCVFFTNVYELLILTSVLYLYESEFLYKRICFVASRFTAKQNVFSLYQIQRKLLWANNIIFLIFYRDINIFYKADNSFIRKCAIAYKGVIL